MSTNRSSEIAEIRTLLSKTLSALDAQAALVRGAMERLERLDDLHVEIAPAPTAAAAPDLQVHAAASEIHGLERMKKVIEEIEEESALEQHGAYLAHADAEARRMEDLATHTAATGLFEALDSLPRVPNSALPRVKIVLRDRVQYRMLGAFLPGETEPVELPTNRWADEKAYSLRIFLLSEQGVVQVVETRMVSSLVHQWMLKGRIAEGEFVQLRESDWALLRHTRSSHVRALTPQDLISTMRHDAAQQGDPEGRHRLSEHNRRRVSVATDLRAHLEGAIQRAVEVRQRAIRDRVQQVEEVRKGAAR